MLVVRPCWHLTNQVIFAVHCYAGLFLLERLQPQMDLETSQALARLAPLHARADSR
jgi:hypothetical protein